MLLRVLWIYHICYAILYHSSFLPSAEKHRVQYLLEPSPVRLSPRPLPPIFAVSMGEVGGESATDQAKGRKGAKAEAEARRET